MGAAWSLKELWDMGGPFMWPLLFFSICTLGLIIERVAYILFHDLNVRKLRKPVMDLALEKKFGEIEVLLAGKKRRNMPAAILKELIRHKELGTEHMEKAVESEAQERVRKLENGFNFLNALASIAPLTGFLGTVSGMIGAFKSIASSPEVTPQLVANDIYEALVTTVFGLIIAIAALTGYNILAHRVDTFAAEVTKTSSDIISLMAMQDNKENNEMGENGERLSC